VASQAACVDGRFITIAMKNGLIWQVVRILISGEDVIKHAGFR